MTETDIYADLPRRLSREDLDAKAFKAAIRQMVADGVPPSQVAKAAGLSPSRISQIARGRNRDTHYASRVYIDAKTMTRLMAAAEARGNMNPGDLAREILDVALRDLTMLRRFLGEPQGCGLKRRPPVEKPK